MYINVISYLCHKILLYKLQKYGISSNCLNWFESYLNNRKQIVKCNDKLSQPCILSIGFPQLTILGPTLFILYFNDFSNYIDPTLCVRYADDTSLVRCLGGPILLKFNLSYN